MGDGWKLAKEAWKTLNVKKQRRETRRKIEAEKT